MITNSTNSGIFKVQNLNGVIASFWSTADLTNAMRVCHKFHDLFSSNRCWRPKVVDLIKKMSPKVPQFADMTKALAEPSPQDNIFCRQVRVYYQGQITCVVTILKSYLINCGDNPSFKQVLEVIASRQGLLPEKRLVALDSVEILDSLLVYFRQDEVKLSQMIIAAIESYALKSLEYLHSYSCKFFSLSTELRKVGYLAKAIWTSNFMAAKFLLKRTTYSPDECDSAVSAALDWWRFAVRIEDLGEYAPDPEKLQLSFEFFDFLKEFSIDLPDATKVKLLTQATLLLMTDIYPQSFKDFLLKNKNLIELADIEIWFAGNEIPQEFLNIFKDRIALFDAKTRAGIIKDMIKYKRNKASIDTMMSIGPPLTEQHVSEINGLLIKHGYLPSKNACLVQ